MGTINLTNSKGRDAQVETEAVSAPSRVRWVDEKGRGAERRKVLKATLDRAADALAKAAGSLEKVADALVRGDPEVDVETYGTFLETTSRVYVDPDRKVVHAVQEQDIVRAPDGTVKERRPRIVATSNTSTEGVPLRWSGKLMKKSEVYNRFVFVNKRQIVHVNGLTYDFLFEIAKELEEKKSMLLLGSGPKGTQPLVFQRGGTPYRGFLEGRTQGDRYCLVLHLSNYELKAPPPMEPSVPPAAAASAPAPAPVSVPVPVPVPAPVPPAPTSEAPPPKPPPEAPPPGEAAPPPAKKKRAPRKPKDATGGAES